MRSEGGEERGGTRSYVQEGIAGGDAETRVERREASRDERAEGTEGSTTHPVLPPIAQALGEWREKSLSRARSTGAAMQKAGHQDLN